MLSYRCQLTALSLGIRTVLLKKLGKEEILGRNMTTMNINDATISRELVSIRLFQGNDHYYIEATVKVCADMKEGGKMII